jgi:hypothetical protein
MRLNRDRYLVGYLMYAYYVGSQHGLYGKP